MKLWHTICFVMLFFVLLLGTSLNAVLAAEQVTIVLDNVVVETDVPAFIDDNDRTIVPVRFVSEALGYQVGWNQDKQRVRISRSEKTIDLYIAQRTAFVNGVEKEMDTTAVLNKSRTMVPLRFLTEEFGLKIEWTQENRTVVISSPLPPASPQEPTPELSPQTGIVTGDVVNIRSGPGIGYDQLTQVTEGTLLVVLEENSAWFRVVVPDGGDGWISGQYFALQDLEPPLENPEPGEVTVPPQQDHTTPAGVTRHALVMKESVNIRSHPDVQSPRVSGVTLGQQLEITGEQNGWYRVRLPDGQSGWIAGWLVAVRCGADKQEPDSDGVPATGLISRWVAGERSDTYDLPAITDIEAKQSGREILLEVKADCHLALPSSFRLDNPERLIFDFKAYLGEDTPPPTLRVNHGSVNCFRLGQFDDQTMRIVADLQGQVSYALTQDAESRAVTIRIRPVNPDDKLIVIDPGHGALRDWGSTDPGAIGPSGLKEQEVVRNISLQLGNILLNEGFTVLYTREGDTQLTLSERAAVADISGAKLFVSVHANASVNRELSGTMTFYHSSKGAVQESQMLANFIQSELLNRLRRQNKGVRSADYAVLRNCPIPAVLVEVAFISNPEEEKLLADPAFQRKAAEAIAIGIKRYLTAVE